ncbi:MAG: aminotransferase-like domain-containing protein [Gaiellaceae bacterium]
MAPISFARGVPAPECLAVDLIADCAKAAIEKDGKVVLSYGTGLGYAPLREWIAERHGAQPAQVLLTNGSLHGFVYLAQHFFAGGRGRALVEAPTYDRPLLILRGYGVEVTPIEMDEDGLDPDALERELKRGPKPAFLYTIPTFQNPSGRTLPVERRRRIVELAHEHDLLVVEDDPYGLIRYEGEPVPTIYELEGAAADKIAYTSSFSKSISPGLRVGYIVLPEELAPKLDKLANSTTISPSLLPEATVLEFVRRGHFEPNLERMTGLLRARRDAMLGALERSFGESARWSHPAGGYFLWLDFPQGVDANELLPRAGEAGVTFCAGTDFFPDARGAGSARLAFSYVSVEEAARGVEILAELVGVPAGA